MLLALALSTTALADIAIEPDPGTTFLSHSLRLEGLAEHPTSVLVVHDGGSTISAHRAYSADREAQQTLARGGSNRGGGMGAPSIYLMNGIAYQAWSTATDATVSAAREACADRGEGCAHISRFVPSYAPPTGAISCGVSIDLQLSGPDGGPDEVVDVYRLAEASATTCRLDRIAQELSRDGKPVTASTGGCSALQASAASVLAGLALLLGMGRRRRHSD